MAHAISIWLIPKATWIFVPTQPDEKKKWPKAIFFFEEGEVGLVGKNITVFLCSPREIVHPKHVPPKNLLKLFPNPQKCFTSVQKSLSFKYQVISLINMWVMVIFSFVSSKNFLNKFAQTVSKPPEVVHECAEKLKFWISRHFVIKHGSYGHFFVT